MEINLTENKICTILSLKYNFKVIIILHKIIDVQTFYKSFTGIIIIATLALNVPPKLK